MLNTIHSHAHQDIRTVELYASLSEARELIIRWDRDLKLYSLLVEHTECGVQLLLKQANKRVRIAKTLGQEKYFADARTLHHWMASLFPHGKVNCDIQSLYNAKSELPELSVSNSS